MTFQSISPSPTIISPPLGELKHLTTISTLTFNRSFNLNISISRFFIFSTSCFKTRASLVSPMSADVARNHPNNDSCQKPRVVLDICLPHNHPSPPFSPSAYPSTLHPIYILGLTTPHYIPRTSMGYNFSLKWTPTWSLCFCSCPLNSPPAT